MLRPVSHVDRSPVPIPKHENENVTCVNICNSNSADSALLIWIFMVDGEIRCGISHKFLAFPKCEINIGGAT